MSTVGNPGSDLPAPRPGAAQRLADLSPDGVVVTDLDGCVLYANRSYADLVGRTVAELLGAPDGGLGRPTRRGGRWTAVRSGQTVRGSMETLVLADGARRTVEISSTPIDDEGQPAVLSVVRDMSERMAREADLAELRTRDRLSFEHAPIGQALVGMDGRWLAVNPALCQLLGLQADQLESRTFEQVTHPDDIESDRLLMAQMEAGNTSGYVTEKRYRRADGEIVWANVHVALVRDDAGEPLYFITQIEDITDRRRSDAHLRQLSEELRFANDALQTTTEVALAGEARYRALVDHLPETATYLYDRRHRITAASGDASLRPGVDDLDLLGRAPSAIHGTEDATLVHRFLDQAFAGRSTSTELTIEPSGRHHLVDVVAIEPFHPGPPDEVLLVTRDISDRRAKEQALSAAHARYEALVEHSSDLTTISDGNGTLVYVSPAWSQIMGTAPEHAVGTNLLDLLHPDDVTRTAGARARLGRRPGAVINVTCRVRNGAGAWRHVEATVSNRLDDPAVGGIVSNARDVTDRVEAAQRLAHQAMHDPLTDLPNRSLFLDRLAQALARNDRREHSCAVLFIDLDRFKGVNDSLGHSSGDEVLVAVARRIHAALRPPDSVARLGGDEFVVLAEDVGSPQIALQIAERLRATVTEPIQVADRTITVGCSVGIALSGRHRPEDLLQEADIALYLAKERGRNRSEIYDHAMQAKARARHEIEQVLRRAVDRDGIGVVFQPIVDLGTGRVTSTEALARLRLPGATVPAGEFIPVAEDTGLIVPIGATVLDAACAQQAVWADRPGGPATLSVNVSGRQLLSPDFADQVADTLDRHGLRPAQLCLELTESALIDAGPSARRNISDLKSMGLTLALDDFGTGWSSMAYLRRFPIDIVKIDRTFIAGLGTDDEDTEVVRAVISLGHALDLTTVAEGVETADQDAMLHALHCDYAQGFRYGRPLEAAEVDTLIRRGVTGCATPGPAVTVAGGVPAAGV